jgi:transcriptional regulator with XRE-family HTH domain
MTIRELARELGYTAHSYIGAIETGKKTPKVEFILKVADLFDVTMDQLTRDGMDV